VPELPDGDVGSVFEPTVVPPPQFASATATADSSRACKGRISLRIVIGMPHCDYGSNYKTPTG
jgi:hypothetical protein